MRRRITNLNVETLDVHDVSFESAGALGRVNEHLYGSTGSFLR
jgi:hypothetical protein